MESLMPALVDHLEPVGSMLPKHAVILLSDPEKLRRSAEDLAKTANEFLAASWHVAASGHGAGAPISFDEASFLDYAETISSLEYSEHPVIRLTSFGVDTTLTGHVQLDAQNPAEFRGDEAKASQASKACSMPASTSPSPPLRPAPWLGSSVRSTLPASPISTSSALRPLTASWTKPPKSPCSPNAT